MAFIICLTWTVIINLLVHIALRGGWVGVVYLRIRKYLLINVCSYRFVTFLVFIFCAQIGVMVMVHGDDRGLVLPPKVASVQVIVIPVPYKDADTQAIFDACSATVASLSEAGIRAKADSRDNYSPGWKYSHWEMKGVPLRIEIGPKDLANSQVS